MTASDAVVAHPPETSEGWYALHQIYRRRPGARLDSAALAAASPSNQLNRTAGWSAWVQLMGSTADLLILHFRPTLDELAECEVEYSSVVEGMNIDLAYSFLGVTEAGFYHISAQLAADAEKRGGKVGDDLYKSQLEARVGAELASDHIRRRLYPPPPADTCYVCFYPMSKRRQPGQNWYTLPLAERSRLMQSHGVTGRRYAGRIQQVITGSIGFDSWEWGVTLFANDPIDFKKIVTDMRFDEVSAKYAEFGEFYVGKIVAVE